MKRPKSVVLIVCDGWGISSIKLGNAIEQARKPNFDNLQLNYPSISIQASGIAVGLPWGEMGNSETGHLNLGAGLVVYQNLPLISLAIQNDTFFKNLAFLHAIQNVKKYHSQLHLVGLLSPGGIHSHSDHMYALIELAQREDLDQVYVHAITDGRDTPPDVAINYVKEFEQKSHKIGIGKIATIGGRFYAMDRNENWHRTKKYYDAMIHAQGPTANSAQEAIERSYLEKVYDEHIIPVVITEDGDPLPRVQNNDSVIYFNFRPDRARQLTKAIVLPDFVKFDRGEKLHVSFTTMTEYEQDLPVKIAFQPQSVQNPLSTVLSKNKLKQLHIAETEKYAHATYFLNGGRESSAPDEEFILVPSTDVTNYDQAPEMSAQEITDKAIEKITSRDYDYDFIFINYANADMVGHTGNLDATIQAVEFLDEQLKKLVDVILKQNAIAIITADHGNAEQMIDPRTGKIDKEHTSNPIPFIIVHKDLKNPKTSEQVVSGQLTPSGILADIAPTILDIMGIQKPPEMTGTSLLHTMGITKFGGER